VVIGAQSTIYLLLLFCMLNMGVQVEIFAREVFWRVNNSRKPAIFCDVLYHLNVMFLQRVFEALKSVFSNAKTTRTGCTKIHFVSAAQIKELGEIFLMV
jgi:hypothetical protein